MRLVICALWSPAGKGLACWLSFVVSNCKFVTFPCGILGHVWYLIVSIPDLCTLTYFHLCAIFCKCNDKFELPRAFSVVKFFPSKIYIHVFVSELVMFY